MARTRVKKRGGASISSDGSVSGIIEPPPFPVVDFIYKWKNWLNNLYQAVSLNVATLWFNITGVDSASTTAGEYDLTMVDQVLLLNPDTADITVNLLDGDVEDGLSFYIKNIDYTGTYALIINPGTNKIEQAAGAATTDDITIPPLDSYQLIFDSALSTWWII